MRSYLSLCLLTILSCTSAKNIYAVDIFGLWQKSDSSNTYTIQPTGGANGPYSIDIVLVIVSGKYQDIYLGTLETVPPDVSGAGFQFFNVCAAENEPFSACINGSVISDTSIIVELGTCQDKSPDVEVCKYFSSRVELTREIFHDINGIFLVSNGKYFMIESSGGRITAHDINVEDGEVDGYSGNRDGNTGSVTPFDNSGPYMDFNITSASALTVTVTKCNDCDSDDAAETPPGTVFSLTRVTN